MKVGIIGTGAIAASDLLAISLTPFERTFLDFGEACETGRAANSSGVEGNRALELVKAIYESRRTGSAVKVVSDSWSPTSISKPVQSKMQVLRLPFDFAQGRSE